MSFNSLLNQDCEIQRFTKTQSNTGEIDKAWSVSSTPKCRLQKRSVTGGQDLATPYGRASHVIYLPIGTDIRDNDRCEIGGKRFNIVAVQKDSSLHHLEVLAQAIIQK